MDIQKDIVLSVCQNVNNERKLNPAQQRHMCFSNNSAVVKQQTPPQPGESEASFIDDLAF